MYPFLAVMVASPSKKFDWQVRYLDIYLFYVYGLNAAGCSTGWVNYANERSQAALERSSQDAYDIIRLTCSKATVWTLDDVAHLIKILKKRILIYLFIFYPRCHIIWRDDKN